VVVEAQTLVATDQVEVLAAVQVKVLVMVVRRITLTVGPELQVRVLQGATDEMQVLVAVIILVSRAAVAVLVVAGQVAGRNQMAALV
tara:strand:- start:418 stop:678 length:261 start_codon:yes stop_codon:yes gene_type:complete